MPKQLIIDAVMAFLCAGCVGEARETQKTTSTQPVVADCQFPQWIGKPDQGFFRNPYRLS
jgi:predicted lipase